MKNDLLIICMWLLMSGSLFAHSTTPESICRLKFEKIPWESEIDRLEKDLLSAVWTNDLDETNIATGMERVFQFNDYGILDEVTIYDDGHTYYTNHLWSLEVLNGTVFLDVFDNTLREKLLYRLDQTCDGMILTDVATGEQVYLDYNERQPDLYIDAIADNFIGHWKQSAYPYELTEELEECGTFKEMPDAYLELQFNEDGSYVKYMGSQMAESVEKGFWEVSLDGSFLIFHVTKDGHEASVFTTQYARIESAVNQQFSIEYSLTTSDVSKLFCTGVKLFSFTKDYSKSNNHIK